MKFPDSVFDSLPRFHHKIKVSVPKIMKTFGPNSGVATSLTEITDDKEWRSLHGSSITLANTHGI